MIRKIITLSTLSALLQLPSPGFSCSQNRTEPGTGFPPCDAIISSGLRDRVILATSDGYEARVETWWSANARLRPWCFVQPRTTEEVATVVKALADEGPGAGDWHIAVKSGGHHAVGTNSITNGVTIDLGMLNSSHHDPETKLASVYAGARWGNVYSNLYHNGNVLLTGVRNQGVGVGGFLLGGENSYCSGLTGFGCDTIINAEVVLANRTIVNANANENRSLWKVLKGGGMNFGIVTRFDLETLPAKYIAHGRSVIALTRSAGFIDAFVDFTKNPEELGADHLYGAYTHNTELSDDVTIAVVRANTEGNLNTTSFDKINEIPSPLNTGSTLTFGKLPSILKEAERLYVNFVSTLSRTIGPDNYTSDMFLQPLPSWFSDIAERKGGNVLGLDGFKSNVIMWTIGIYVNNGDGAALAIAQAGVRAMTAELKAFLVNDGTSNDFVYLNYADPSQNALGGHGKDNVAFLKEAAKA